MSETLGPGALRPCHWQHLPHLPPQAGSQWPAGCLTCSTVRKGLTQSRPDTQGWGSPWGHGGHRPVPQSQVRWGWSSEGCGRESTAGPARRSSHPGSMPGDPGPWAGPLRLLRECYTTAHRSQKARTDISNEGRYAHTLVSPGSHSPEALSHGKGGTLRTRGRGCTSKSPAAGRGRAHGPWAAWLPRTVRSTQRHRDGEQVGSCQGLGRGRGGRRRGPGCPSGPTEWAGTGQRRRWHSVESLPDATGLFPLPWFAFCYVHFRSIKKPSKNYLIWQMG